MQRCESCQGMWSATHNDDRERLVVKTNVVHD